MFLGVGMSTMQLDVGRRGLRRTDVRSPKLSMDVNLAPASAERAGDTDQISRDFHHRQRHCAETCDQQEKTMIKNSDAIEAMAWFESEDKPVSRKLISWRVAVQSGQGMERNASVYKVSAESNG